MSNHALSSSRRKLLPLGAALLMLGAAAGAASSRLLADHAATSRETTPAIPAGERAADTVTFPTDKQSAAGIEVAVVSAEPLAVRVWRTGRIALNRDRIAHLSPPAEGVVKEVRAKLGQTVAASDVLAVLESRELAQAKMEFLQTRVGRSTERERAAWATETAKNAGELVSALLANRPLDDVDREFAAKPVGDVRQQIVSAYLKRNLLRTQAEMQKQAGAVSDATLRRTESEADAAEAQFKALVEEVRFETRHRAQLADLRRKESETAYDVARTRLLLYGLSPEAVETLDPIAEGNRVGELAVVSPFEGTVVEKHAVTSERVGPQFQMFVLADLATVWVEADIYENDLPLLRELGQRPLEFRSAIAGLAARPAKLVYSGDVVDPASRSLSLTAEAANADRALKPGTFVEVGLPAGDAATALQVPTSAVFRHENRPSIFVQVAEDRFRCTTVTTGRTAGDRIEIVAGLAAGDRVAIRGSFVLKSELLKDQMIGE